MQLDPRFTSESLWAHVAVEFVAALFATLGALGVALLVYNKTRDDQQAIFKAEIDSALEARREEEQAQRRSIKLALHYEVADNLESLGAFWPRIVGTKKKKDDAETIARRLVTNTVPVWSTAIWQGAAATVATALTREQIAYTYQVYKTLADVVATQSRLQITIDSDAADLAAQPETPGLMHGQGGYKIARTDYFRDAANSLIPTLHEKVAAVLERGNPVEADDEGAGIAS